MKGGFFATKIDKRINKDKKSNKKAEHHGNK